GGTLRAAVEAAEAAPELELHLLQQVLPVLGTGIAPRQAHQRPAVVLDHGGERPFDFHPAKMPAAWVLKYWSQRPTEIFIGRAARPEHGARARRRPARKNAGRRGSGDPAHCAQ